MKTIFSPVKHSYLAKIGILLIAVALVAGILSCNGGVVQYDLTIDSTAGGVTTPVEGTHTYDDGTVVDLVATPDCGYAFDNWTGDTTDIDDVNAAATNITMNADYSITANFVLLPPDHFKFYEVYWKTEPPVIGMDVQLVDQFGTFNATVMEATLFGNPVEKEHTGVTPISDPNRHYTLYYLDYDWEVDAVTRSVEVSNQFQEKVELTVWGPVALAVPTQKEDHEMVECLNHYLVYLVDEADWEEFTPVEGVNLKDQFIPDGEDVTVKGPYYFANPVEKTVVGSGDVAEIEDEDLHWVLYDIGDEQATSIGKTIQIANQFGNDQTLNLTYRELLAVPSEKNVPPTPPLDHFKCYNAAGPAPGEEGVWVNLVDQFHDNYFEGFVTDPLMFCNPVDKVHGTVQIFSNPDNHLTVYKLTDTPDNWYTVTIDNQFNDAAEPQALTVYGPVALAVPTQKLEPGDHGMPKYLDHYLLYEVWEPVPVDETVDLNDQFPGVAENVTVGPPIYFANPAIKGYVDYEPGFWDPDEHLVFYAISDNDEFSPSVTIENQFFWEEPAYLDLYPEGQLLAVPSVKIAWAPTEAPE